MFGQRFRLQRPRLTISSNILLLLSPRPFRQNLSLTTIERRTPTTLLTIEEMIRSPAQPHGMICITTIKKHQWMSTKPIILNVGSQLSIIFLTRTIGANRPNLRQTKLACVVNALMIESCQLIHQNKEMSTIDLVLLDGKHTMVMISTQ